MSLLKTLKAADKLLSSHHKWMKHDDHNGYGRFCLGGAITEVCKRHGNTPKDIRPILNELAGGCYIAFNDSPRTTFKDIKALLRRAIRKAKLA